MAKYLRTELVLDQLIETVETLRVRGIGFRSLTEALDTTTAQGRLVFHMFGALADDAECAVMRSDAIEIHEPRGFQRRGAPHNPGPPAGPSA